jgi:uncharacterized membrane protein
MNYGFNNNPGHGLWMVGGFFLLLIAIAAIVLLIIMLSRHGGAASTATPHGPPPADRALDTLRQRFAEGVIDEDEFQRRLELLRPPHVAG